MKSIPTIPEFYAGKRVFITGATGFMGKVLVEKLLRSCVDVDQLYVLVRSKAGNSAADRWAKLGTLPCFDRLHKEQPLAFFNKVTVLDGDVSEDRLGISKEDYELLATTTDVVFHAAATIRFNDALPDAIKVNLFGTKNVVDLAVAMKNLQVLVHVSTTYCFCHKTKTIEEKIYPADIDWRTVLEIKQNIDPVSLEILCKKFTDFSPNTYVFTKGLAEQIINDYKDRIPVVIIRPSIVISSWKEPMPGWVDNINGPIGLILGGAKGVVRITLSNPDAIPDYIPVDMTCKAMIIAAWKTSFCGVSQKLGRVEVYNSSSTQIRSISNTELLDLCKKVVSRMPVHQILWSTSYDITKSVAVYRIRAFFAHFLVALLVDTTLRIFGRKPMLTKIQIKIHSAMMALGYFTTREWTFQNHRFRALSKAVFPCDKEDFDFCFDSPKPLEYFRTAFLGVKKYILHEDPVDQPKARKKAKRLIMLDKALRTLFLLAIFYWLYCQFGILQ